MHGSGADDPDVRNDILETTFGMMKSLTRRAEAAELSPANPEVIDGLIMTQPLPGTFQSPCDLGSAQAANTRSGEA